MEHWYAMVRVVHYLKGTCTLPLALGGNSLQLIGYTDSDYANDLDTRHSVGGYCFTLGSGMVSWSSCKQQTVTNSSTAVEYIAAAEASHKCMWLCALLASISLAPSTPTPILCDNNSAISLSQDQLFHAHVKHLDVHWHYLHERVKHGNLVLSRVHGVDDMANTLTKPLSPICFNCLGTFLNLH